MSDVFYRFHWTESPEFCPENAFSALWGSERSPDGSHTRCGCRGYDQGDMRECRQCEGGGVILDFEEGSANTCRACEGNGGFPVGCLLCEGTGWQECARGYSCFPTPQQLINYFTQRGRMKLDDDDGRVVVFAGTVVDHGFEDEPTVIPDSSIPPVWMTWREFTASVSSSAGVGD